MLKQPQIPAARRNMARVNSASSPYARYEAAKQEWARQNPEATPQQHEAAMQALAKRLGV